MDAGSRTTPFLTQLDKTVRAKAEFSAVITRLLILLESIVQGTLTFSSIREFLEQLDHGV